MLTLAIFLAGSVLTAFSMNLGHRRDRERRLQDVPEVRFRAALKEGIKRGAFRKEGREYAPS